MSRWITPLLLMLLTACGRTPAPAKHYSLQGQVLTVDASKNQLVVAHEDIKDFMPAMTMPYKVRGGSLEGTKAGDLIDAILVVEEVDAYLTDVKTTGHAELPERTATPQTAEAIAPGTAVADISYVDQDGQSRRLSDLRGHRVALTFIYTRCPLPDFCPLMDRNFAQMQKLLTATPARADVRLLTMTVDPAYDTPSVLKAHAATLNADPRVWSFATGDGAAIRSFASQFGLYYEPDSADSNVVVHNLRTAVIDSEGKLVKIENANTWTAAGLVADIDATPAPRR